MEGEKVNFSSHKDSAEEKIALDFCCVHVHGHEHTRTQQKSKAIEFALSLFSKINAFWLSVASPRV